MMSPGDSRGTGLVRSAWRNAGLLVLLFLLAFVSWRCTDDPAAPGGGAVELAVDWSGYLARGTEDVVHLEIRDSSGHLWTEPQEQAIGEGDDILFDLELSEGDGLRVALWIDSANEAGPGITAEGETSGVRVRAARTTEVEVTLGSRVPTLQAIEAAPGDLEYEVAWSAVPTATGYELVESTNEGTQTFETDATSLSLPITEARAAALAGEGELTYRVRAKLVRGDGLFSEPVAFAIEDVRDLPFVESVFPLEGAEAVRDTVAPVLVFDREMDWSTLTLATIALVDAQSELPVAVVPRGEGDRLFLDHPSALRRGRTFRLTLSGPIADLAGHPFDQEPGELGLQGFSSTFSVEVYDPLRVVGVTPEDGTESVSIGSELDVTLSRAADPSSLTSSTVVLEDGAGTSVGTTVTWFEDEFRVHVAPTSPLTYDADYTLRVTTNVLDLRGEPLDQDPETEIPVFEEFTSRFHTEVQPIGPKVVSTVPAEGEQNHPVDQVLVVTFDRPIDLSTVRDHFRVRKLPVNAAILGQTTNDAERKVFTFTPTGGLEAGVRYRFDLTNGLLDDDGVPLDQDPDTPGFQGFQAEFRAQASFGVSSVSPADRSQRVALNQSVVVTFPTALDPSTLEAGTSLLDGAVPFEVTRSLSTDGRVVTMVPVQPYDTFTQYKVRIDEDLRSSLGDRFDQDLIRPGYQAFESVFTTKPDSIPPRVDPAGLVPQGGATGVSPDITVQIPFTKRILPASANAETVLLRRVGGGTVSGTVSVSTDSTVVSFDPAAPLVENAFYELEVQTWIVDIFDVRLDQDPVQPDRQDFRATFQIDHERVPPRVITVSPGDGLEDVALTTDVELFFDEPMDPTSLLSAIRLLDPEEQPVSGTVTVAEDSVRATFLPTAPLRENRDYTVRVEVTATDRWGNPLDQDQGTGELDPFTSSFQTQADVVGPVVLSTSPLDGADGVEPDTEITLDFDEAIEPSSLGGSSITIAPEGGDPLPLAVLELTNPLRVRLVPAADLETSTDYVVTVGDAITDTLGNGFDQIPGTPEFDPFVLSFRTREENDPPFVLDTVFEDFPPPRETQPRVAFSEPIDPTSLDDGDVTLVRAGGSAVPIALSFLSPDTLLVEPQVLLEPLTSYELTVSGLSDLVGNPFDQYPETAEIDPFVQPFQTARDETSPRVLEISPEDGSEGARPDVVIALTFSEPMRTGDFDDFTLQVVRLEGSQEYPANGDITWNEDETVFYFTPDTELLLGFVYEVRADYRLRDLAGNPLDQDPDTPEEEVFESFFRIGDFPEPVVSGSVCSDTTFVTFDATGSLDPDGSITSLTFEWGDGDVTIVDDPSSEDYVQSHAYPCLDFAGCDGIDNDGDGDIDGDDCNESYRLILKATDDDGLVGADTSGVSFCAFGALSSDPVDGDMNVPGNVGELRILFTRPIAEASLDPTNLRLATGPLPTPIDSLTWGVDQREVVAHVSVILTQGVTYVLEVLDSLLDESGMTSDQDPCTPERDPYSISFRVLDPMPRPIGRPEPATSGRN
ncbi:MAG: Ig-like domain-containing protein [Candidatus Eisenbacteria bacterium]|nr:Ig-like domain-containing protein [Candidatus Eisenbacteria bacterium]